MKALKTALLIVASLLCFAACSDDDSEFAQINSRRPEYSSGSSVSMRSAEIYKGSVFVNNTLTSTETDMIVFSNSRLSTLNLQINKVSFGEEYTLVPRFELRNLEKQGSLYTKTVDTISGWIVSDVLVNTYNNNIILNALIKPLNQQENISMSLRYEGVKQ